MSDIAQQLATALSRIDLVGPQAAFTALRDEDARDHEALDQGQAQLANLDQQIREAREDGPDPEQAADALRSGCVTTLPPDVEALMGQRAAVRSGLVAINDSFDDRSRKRGDLRQSVALASAPHLESVFAALRKQAEDGARILAEAYAGAAALNDTVRTAGGTGLISDLSATVAEAAIAKLIERKTLQVPSDIIAALRNGELAMRLSGGMLRSKIDVPDRR